MKRSAKIYILLLIWISAMLQFFINDRLDISETLAQISETHEDITASVQTVCWGVYGDAAYSDRTAEKIITNTGAQLGMTGGVLSEKNLSSGKCFCFSGTSGTYNDRIDFITNQKDGCSYLVLHTDNTKKIRAIRTFYTKLNSDYHMSIDVELVGVTEDLDDFIFDAFDISHIQKSKTGIYGKVYSEAPLPEFQTGKNASVTTSANAVSITFGDASELDSLYQ